MHLDKGHIEGNAAGAKWSIVGYGRPGEASSSSKQLDSYIKPENKGQILSMRQLGMGKKDPVQYVMM